MTMRGMVVSAIAVAAIVLASPAVQPLDDATDRIPDRSASASDAAVVARHGGHVPPDWDPGIGIRPGGLMSAPVGCTFNFVFESTTDDTLYIGTAGHCVNEGSRVSAEGVGEFGTVVFSVADGFGADFALIRIDDDRTDEVSPTVATWGGPVAVDDGDSLPGETLYETGWGIATDARKETRNRVHVENAQTMGFVSWDGVGSGGDSGAPILDSEGEALAVHTHGLTPIAGVVSEIGTHVPRALSLSADAGYNVTLVPGGTFHPVS